jgi:hypothetical protein
MSQFCLVGHRLLPGGAWRTLRSQAEPGLREMAGYDGPTFIPFLVRWPAGMSYGVVECLPMHPRRVAWTTGAYPTWGVSRVGRFFDGVAIPDGSRGSPRSGDPRSRSRGVRSTAHAVAAAPPRVPLASLRDAAAVRRFFRGSTLRFDPRLPSRMATPSNVVTSRPRAPKRSPNKTRRQIGRPSEQNQFHRKRQLRLNSWDFAQPRRSLGTSGC